MIDSIKIILKDFSGDLSNCTFVEPKKLIKDIEEKEYHYDNYRLYNHSQSAKHFLKVSKKTNKATKKVTVTLTGSLRKRSYNRVTLLDMPQSTFVQTLKGIAKELNISFEELRRANLRNAKSELISELESLLLPFCP